MFDVVSGELQLNHIWPEFFAWAYVTEDVWLVRDVWGLDNVTVRSSLFGALNLLKLST